MLYKSQMSTKIIQDGKVQIVNDLRNLISLYGFEETYIPAFENYEQYNSYSPMDRNKIIKFISPTGDVMALQPDPTTSIARKISLSGKKNDDIFKLFYISDSFKNNKTSAKNINSDTPIASQTQFGVEFFGNSDIKVDAEIITIAYKALKAINSNSILEINFNNFIYNILLNQNIESSTYDLMVNAIEKKNISKIKKLLIENNLPIELAELFEFSGTIKDLKTFFNNNESLLQFDSSIKTSFTYFKDLYKLLAAYSLDDQLIIDFSIIGNMNYYTGFILKGFIKGFSKEILTGGRYDNLSFNEEKLKACGFAVNVDYITRYMEISTSNDRENFVIYDNDNKASSIEIAETLRKKGFCTEIKNCESEADGIEIAKAENTNYVLFQSENDVQFIDIAKNSSVKVTKENLYDFLNSKTLIADISI